MELIVSADSRYDEYEDLLLERDQLRKDASSIWIDYIQAFGQLISDVYEEKLESIKCKKTIAYYQAALNHGGVVDPEAMQQYLEREMASYYAHLKKLQEDNELCRNAKQSTSYEVQRAKVLYRRLVKLLHPDINPQTDKQESLRDLWQRVMTAYAHNDVKELSELEVLVRRALKELGGGDIRVEIPDIEEKIASLRNEIAEIKRTEPYTYRDILEDEDAAARKKKELEEELASYKKYHKELDEVIRSMTESEGVKIRWLMN